MHYDHDGKHGGRQTDRHNSEAEAESSNLNLQTGTKESYLKKKCVKLKSQSLPQWCASSRKAISPNSPQLGATKSSND